MLANIRNKWLRRLALCIVVPCLAALVLTAKAIEHMSACLNAEIGEAVRDAWRGPVK
jgi:hypothetical protein